MTSRQWLKRSNSRESIASSDDCPFDSSFSTPTELTKVGILFDVETTGLDTASDEVVELGMVKFSYHPDGTVAAVLDTFSSFNEPSRTIPEEAIKLHGITNEMAAGHKIDGDAITAFASDAAIIIAHNAAFDRKFAERYWPVFASKPWACSVNQIEWRAHGFEGSRLGYLLNGIGMFHRSHRAVDDCHALLEILAHTIPGPIEPRCHCCLRTPAEKQFGSGLNKPRSTSKTSSKSAAIAGVLAMRAAQRPGMSISMKPNETTRSRI